MLQEIAAASLGSHPNRAAELLADFPVVDELIARNEITMSAVTAIEHTREFFHSLRASEDYSPDLHRSLVFVLRHYPLRDEALSVQRFGDVRDWVSPDG